MPQLHSDSTDGLRRAMTLEDTLQAVTRGTEFFRHGWEALQDGASVDGGPAGESLLPGWTRAHVVAHVGYNALAIGRLAQWAVTGVETPMYASGSERDAEIAQGALLAPDALRELFDDSAAALDRRWRELPDAGWEFPVRNGQGRVIPLSETVWMRTREVWIHAVDLNSGASFQDIPAGVLERILGDITGAWQARGESGIRLTVADAAWASSGAADATVQLCGSLAALTAWAAGRGIEGVSTGTGETPAAPRWL